MADDADPARLRATALRLLAQREHSRHELQRKLLQSARRDARRRAQAAVANEALAAGAGPATAAGECIGGDTVEDDSATLALAGQIDTVLNTLAQRGLLSDQRVAQQWLASRAPRHGERRLRQDLTAKGLAPELVQQALAEARSTELPRARAVWQRRYAAPPADAAEQARQMRFLAARGFTLATIGALMKQLRQGSNTHPSAWDDDPPVEPD